MNHARLQRERVPNYPEELGFVKSLFETCTTTSTTVTVYHYFHYDHPENVYFPYTA